ncbi:putative porin [Terrimonas sp. NA20]|uniref:Porin n=1 Tax=Terrimonas ginsenosidimutans TaxID=2908004 RepID=A0ABS9KTA1_9BACT|nr:putative porin [Terrimonas ginsenosidimutans]MCG2615562.1 putative porin [Terrimonas ginsenosidimutans]
MFKLKLNPTYLLLAALLFISLPSFSQRDILRQGGSRIRQMGNSFSGSGGGQDSLKRRDKNEDSITIRYRYLDSTRNYMLDSSVDDFSRRFPNPPTHITLGNTGTAARNLLFKPSFKPGFDPGMHAFDIYRWSVDRVRFFNTTRPYSELNYVLSSQSEQMIELMHTQNIKPNWNFHFMYRLINATGFFRNQKSNHNNYLLTSWYQSVNKRYNNYFIILANSLQSGENGGIRDSLALQDPLFKDRFRIETRLGGSESLSPNFFNTDVGTGNRYRDLTFLLRQQYDLGKKDSLVTDSSVIPLFYPRLRFEYTAQFTTRNYEFRDYLGDSTYYDSAYHVVFENPVDTFQIKDSWREIINDFSVYQFPDAKNLQQFVKVGASVQNLSLKNTKGNANFYNVLGHAEYRNRTRNQQWIIEANGSLYFVGTNSGDYHAYGSLQRFIGRKNAYAQIGFENVNRTPSFYFDPRSAFYITQQPQQDFKKENTIHLFGAMYQPFLQLRLAADYYVMTNYTYVKNMSELAQEGTLFNMLQISAQKTINLGRWWKWHADIYYQQRIGNAEVNVPTLYTRNRIGYEGKLGLKNLNIAFGAEVRYHTNYKGDGYSPLLGKFYYQDNDEVKLQMPHIAGYVHFRIKGFKFYFRAENLNTAQLSSTEGFGFTRNNAEVPGYPYPGLLMRFGIFWSFVN